MKIILLAAGAATFLVACDNTADTLIKDETTASGYVSYPSQYAPSTDGCSRNGQNGPVSVSAIEQSIREGWPDDAKILATVMNGDAPEQMREFAHQCMGFTA